MNRLLVSRICLVFALLSTVSAMADAQWVMIGRKVIGRVTTLAKEHDDKNPGYEVASVILDADAGKVYATAVGLLEKNTTIAVAAKDDTRLYVAFTQGDLAVELRVTELGDKLSQLMIVSAKGHGKKGEGTSVVLDAVKRVCDELG